MTNARPSVDPANDDSLLGTANTILRKFLQGVDDCLPARVVAFNRATGLAQVQPLVSMLTTSGQQVPRATVAAVKVLMLGSADLMLSFPIKPGDLGWLKACDRDISMFTQSFAAGPPNTIRFHSFEDAWFIPDCMRNFTINAEDADRVTLQSKGGAARVAVGANIVKLTVGAMSLSMTPAGTVVTGPLTINGVIFNSHVHGGIQPGGANTAGPV